MAEPFDSRGPIAWMVRHRVAPNILMVVLLVGGLLSASRTTQEVFPEFDLDMVEIRVPYPGASPEEVEDGIVRVVEEAVRALEGAVEVISYAAEGFGQVVVEIDEDADAQKALLDIQEAVARIRTFPVDAEEPAVSLVLRRRDVLSLQIYGNASEFVLHELAEQVRDRLLQEAAITQVDLRGARASEIHVEVSQEDLRRYGLTLSGIAARLRATAIDLPGGTVETTGGEVLLRVKERRDWAREFAEIPIVTTAGGAAIRLGDVARVTEGFEEANRSAVYNGQRAIGLAVYRIGDQTPEQVATAARSALDEIAPILPPGVEYAIDDDDSIIYAQRRNLLIKNLLLGLVLVLGTLGLFLEPRLAFWVTMGIPTSFLGAFLLLPWIGITLNMISLFAFLIALGIVVDDAIVAGENIHEYRERGLDPEEAAIRGARDVATPISGAILTNLIAFAPLALIPGTFGKVWFAIPFVVGSVFLISWVESLGILPSHLAHAGTSREGRFSAVRARFQRAFRRFISQRYAPLLNRALERRYLTAALCVGLLVLVFGYVASGRMGMVLMPKVESDRAVATARLPFGSPESSAEAVRDHLLAAASRVTDAGGGDRLVSGTFALIDESTVEVDVYLTPPEERPLSTAEVARQWREEVGALPGVESLKFESDAGGPGRGPGITVELSHRDIDILDRASERLAAALDQYPNTLDVDDGYAPGKTQLDFRLRPDARSLGLTSADVARQVRDAFYGAEALRQQRGRNEVKVLVRRPASERVALADIETLFIRTPTGRDVPLTEIANIERGRAFTQITRRDGRRTVTVTATVVPADQTNQVLKALQTDVLPDITRDFPGLTSSFEGRQADMRESLSALATNFALALLLIYIVLALPFRSYVQPAIVMLAIPFGFVGAVLGHWIMGYSLSVISMMGIVALAGVVVNDSLVMIDFANRRRADGASPREAIHDAGVRRFRPILLTTLTTFGGLAPMIFETSRQARFMIPMAISLGYGILFATFITLLIVPAFYLIIEDLRALTTRAGTGRPEAVRDVGAGAS